MNRENPNLFIYAVLVVHINHPQIYSPKCRIKWPFDPRWMKLLDNVSVFFFPFQISLKSEFTVLNHQNNLISSVGCYLPSLVRNFSSFGTQWIAPDYSRLVAPAAKWFERRRCFLLDENIFNLSFHWLWSIINMRPDQASTAINSGCEE